MPLFRKDFFAGTRSQQQTPPQPPQETIHYSTLFLVAKLDLEQVKPELWENKNIVETPADRSNGKTIFDPDSHARRAQAQHNKALRQRKKERDHRSIQPEWFQGHAQDLAKCYDEIEDVSSDLRDAARRENWYLELVELRESRKEWEDDDNRERNQEHRERNAKQALEQAVKAVRPPEWVREYEPVLSSSASIRSVRSNHSRRISTASFASVSDNRNSMLSTTSWEPRNSMLSTRSYEARNSMLSTTTRSTARSSFMSWARSSASSPISSGLPSPILDSYEEYAENEEDESRRHAKAKMVLSRNSSELPPPMVAA
ncbi:hypothetical protein BZA77DRAFT_161070 [Pyronema omphalodes]|nr:hypothetical protein BZA77DRAFT_161070 [Pyronema omphalodes]